MRVRPLSLGLLVAGCALSTGSRHDDAADFSTLRSYAWGIDELSSVEPVEMAAADTRKIRDSVERVLAERGFERTEFDDATLVVTFSVGTRANSTESAPGWTLLQDLDEPTDSEGSLSISVFDRETRRPVWHGWASGALKSGNNPHRRIDRTVDQILEPFPPGEWSPPPGYLYEPVDDVTP